MARKMTLLTVAEIALRKGVSESTVRRALKGVPIAGTVDGYNGRFVGGYSKEQIAAAWKGMGKMRPRRITRGKGA